MRSSIVRPSHRARRRTRRRRRGHHSGTGGSPFYAPTRPHPGASAGAAHRSVPPRAARAPARRQSAHTCDSYAYSFRALFEFVLQRLKTAPCALTLEQLDASLVGAFLEQLETTPRRIGGWRSPRSTRRCGRGRAGSGGPARSGLCSGQNRLRISVRLGNRAGRESRPLGNRQARYWWGPLDRSCEC
jgi:hypothetical protein